MRKTVQAAAVAFMALQMGTPGARAADLDTPPLYQPENSPMVEFGGGWYLRGDLGYSTMGVPTPAYGLTEANTDYYGIPYPNYRSTGVTSQSILTDPTHQVGAFGATLGVGYTFNNWFRMDATFDWRQPQSGTNTVNYSPLFNSSSNYLGYGCEGPNGPVGCYKTDQTNIQSWTGLLNAYGDIGNWFGFTPYVGAGIGVTNFRASTNESWYFANGVPYGNNGLNNYCPTGANGCYFNGYPGNITPNQIRNNFSYALMAGLSYDLVPHVKLDISYRYLNMGSLTGINAAGNTTRFTIDSQEVRAGLRFTPDL